MFLKTFNDEETYDLLNTLLKTKEKTLNDNYSLEEIVDYLSWNSNSLSKNQISELKDIVMGSTASMLNQMKMVVIEENLDKYSYLQICEMFEGKLPYQTLLK